MQALTGFKGWKPAAEQQAVPSVKLYVARTRDIVERAIDLVRADEDGEPVRYPLREHPKFKAEHLGVDCAGCAALWMAINWPAHLSSVPAVAVQRWNGVTGKKGVWASRKAKGENKL